MEKARLFAEHANNPSTRSGNEQGFPEDYDFDALIAGTTKRVVKGWGPVLEVGLVRRLGEQWLED